MKTYRKSLAAAAGIALAAAATVIAPAIAGVGPVEAPTASVAHRDLDLSSAAGRKTLDGRLRRAAKAVCPDATSLGPVVMTSAARGCIRRALDTARGDASLAALKAEGRVAAR